MRRVAGRIPGTVLFVTIDFLVFFVIVYALFWVLPVRVRITFLAAASLVFYASWSPVFALHFVGVAFLNWFVMEVWRRRPRKWLFVALQLANVLNIAFFKYFYLLADSVGYLFDLPFLREGALREQHRSLGMVVALPLAISFYTFQVMSYGIDLYRGRYTRKHSFLDFFLYLAFFPQLIAGPIMRASELLGQISDYETGKHTLPNPVRMKKGLWLIWIGIVKKVFIAEELLRFAAPLTTATEPASFAPEYAWLWIVANLVMLYADFSAYSDFARGFGYMLGFDIPINFRAPFFMHSFTDLWRRWHLTFVAWLRDYVYIPLGGNRLGEARQYVNLVLTFTLGGLWHGATYSFLVWGLIMGALLSAEAFLRQRGFPDLPAGRVARVVRVGGVWLLYLSTGVFFFEPSPDKAIVMFMHLFDVRALGVFDVFGVSGAFGAAAGQALPRVHVLVLAIAGSVVFQWFENSPRKFIWFRRHDNILLAILYVVVVVGLVQAPRHTSDFFYFQF